VDSSKVMTREQWQEWHRQEETEAFREFLKVQIQEAKEAWAKGQFDDADPMKAAVKNAAAAENVRFAQKLIEMDFEEYLSQMEDINAE
jgi:hypothetical protein